MGHRPHHVDRLGVAVSPLDVEEDHEAGAIPVGDDCAGLEGPGRRGGCKDEKQNEEERPVEHRCRGRMGTAGRKGFRVDPELVRSMAETAHLPAINGSEPSVGVASPMLHVQGIDDDLLRFLSRPTVYRVLCDRVPSEMR